MATVGIIANPHAGKDIRRLVAHASPTSDVAKIGIIRRAVLGAVEGGADRVLLAPDGHKLSQRAVEELNVEVKVELIAEPTHGRSADSVTMARRMAEDGDVGAVIVLGGDGTQRDVAKGWLDLPLMPISTGTNNVFPRLVEATLAGLAAGYIASETVSRADGCYRADVIHVEFSDGSEPDLALVDVALVEGSYSGARAVWDPALMIELIACIAEPATVGLSSIAGLLHPVGRGEPGGVQVRFVRGERTPGERVLRAPIAPGLFTDLRIASFGPLADGTSVTLAGPGVLSFDGERDRVLRDGTHATATVLRDGPFVVDVARTIAAASRRADRE